MKKKRKKIAYKSAEKKYKIMILREKDKFKINKKNMGIHYIQRI